MNKDLITIFTIAYNTEQYIEQCIKSILGQTYTNIQYVILDNGSTDKTKDIIKNYAQLDQRITYVRFDKNQIGVFPLIKGYIKGKYFTTVDSDDYIELNYIEKIYNYTVQNNLDICITGSTFHLLETGEVAYRQALKNECFSKEDIADKYIYLYPFLRTIWGKLYKSDLINYTEGELYKKLVDSGGYGGDTFSVISRMSNAKKIGITTDVLHHYRVHKKSVSYKYNSNRFQSDIILYDLSVEFLKKLGEVSSDNIVFANLVYFNSIMDTLKIILDAQIDNKDKISEINNIISEPHTIFMIKLLINIQNIDIKFSLTESLTSICKYIIQIYQNIKDEQALLGLKIMLIKLYPNYKENEILLNKCLQELSYDISIFQDLLNDDILLALKKISLENRASIYRTNLLLSNIKNNCFFEENSNLVNNIFEKKYNEALDQIINLAKTNDLSYDLIYLMINLSAFLEDSQVYIYSKKLEICYYLDNSEVEKAKQYLEELKELIIDDDVKLLEEELNNR